MTQPVRSLPHIFSGGPYIMGIVNVTPDSFSDGGDFYDTDKAIAQGLQLIEEGADILDVGGESTRPGARPAAPQDEIARILPVIEALRGKARFLSVDTRNAATMAAALEAGADAINDISALRHDSDSLAVAAKAAGPVFLMHMQGTPETMQKNPTYNNAVEEIIAFLQERIVICEAHGIGRHRLVCDPGIGFGKTVEQNLIIFKNIKKFDVLDVPVLLGVSRKGFIGRLSRNEPAKERAGGSVAAALWGLRHGVTIFRVHDVAMTRQAFAIYEAIDAAPSSPA